MTSDFSNLKPNMIVRGPILPEPVQVIVTIPMGDSIKLIGKGLRTGQVHEPILSSEQLATLEATPEVEPFDGDAGKFRLGIGLCGWHWPMNTILSLHYPLPGFILYPTNLKQSTTIS